MGKFVVRKTNTGVKFDLKATNGQVIATSEVYTTKAACMKGIDSVRKNGATPKVENQTEPDYKTLTNPKYELYQDKAGYYRFRLKARNGKIVGISEGYTGKAGCLGGIESVKTNAPLAQTEG